MKFGQTLKEKCYPPWREHYLEYNAMKKLISLICLAEGIADDDAKPIQEGNLSRAHRLQNALVAMHAPPTSEPAP